MERSARRSLQRTEADDQSCLQCSKVPVEEESGSTATASSKDNCGARVGEMCFVGRDERLWRELLVEPRKRVSQPACRHHSDVITMTTSQWRRAAESARGGPAVSTLWHSGTCAARPRDRELPGQEPAGAEVQRQLLAQPTQEPRRPENGALQVVDKKELLGHVFWVGHQNCALV